MCCFNEVNLSAILLVHKRVINKECTVTNNNEEIKQVIGARSNLFKSSISN